MKLRWLFVAFLVGTVAACPLNAQQVLGPAHWDSLSATCQAFNNNNANRTLRTRCINQVAKFRLLPVPPIVVRDTVIVVDTVFVGDSVPPIPPQDTVVIPIPPEDTVPDVPPPTGEQMDTLRGSVTGDVRCRMFSKCIVTDLTITRGNLLVESSTLVMRPGSRLRFTGCDPGAYVGGGMQYTPELGATDCGLWVWGSGKLDIQGTPKTAWNRTGQASDWSSTDELYVAPTAFKDFQVRRYMLGAPVPRADPTLPPAEVANVTRDIVIEGTGHIHIHSTEPQRIEWVHLRGLGISNASGNVLGRYALHLHHTSARGTIIRGVAAVNSQGKVFVPHMTNGVTLADNVAVNSRGNCMWWDLGEPSDDILIDRMACLGMDATASPNGALQAITLGAGANVEIRNSVAAAACGSDMAHGFDWPEMPVLFTPEPNPVWIFNAGNVAHNNCGAGVRFWNNNAFPHLVADYVGYHNAVGIENGAYANPNRYENVRLFKEGHGGWFADLIRPAIIWQTNSNTVGNVPNGTPAGISNSTIIAAEGPAITVGHRNVPGTTYARYVNVTLVPASGQPKLLIDTGGHPWLAEFIRSNLQTSDVVFRAPSGPGGEGSEVRIDNDGDGTFECRVWVEGGSQRSRCQ